MNFFGSSLLRILNISQIYIDDTLTFLRLNSVMKVKILNEQSKHRMVGNMQLLFLAMHIDVCHEWRNANCV